MAFKRVCLMKRTGGGRKKLSEGGRNETAKKEDDRRLCCYYVSYKWLMCFLWKSLKNKACSRTFRNCCENNSAGNPFPGKAPPQRARNGECIRSELSQKVDSVDRFLTYFDLAPQAISI